MKFPFPDQVTLKIADEIIRYARTGVTARTHLITKEQSASFSMTPQQMHAFLQRNREFWHREDVIA